MLFFNEKVKKFEGENDSIGYEQLSLSQVLSRWIKVAFPGYVLKSGLACGMGWDQIPNLLCHPTATNGCLIEKDFWRTRKIETDLPMFPTSPRRYALLGLVDQMQWRLDQVR